MDGRIARIVPDRGFGFIIGTDGNEYFFHRTALKNWDGEFKDLKKGTEVEFEDTDESAKGLRAETVYLK